MKPLLLCTALLATSLMGCRTESADPGAADSTAAAAPAAGPTYAAMLASQGGSTVTGQVTFTPEGEGVRVVATVTGLTPGEHGFHVHEGMSCAAADLPDDPDTDPNPAGAAGPHFAGADSTHGAPDGAARHDGDFGNLTADASGTATYDRVIPSLRLTGERSIVGRAVIVHANPDDLTTQPSGNSGARLACGLVEAAPMTAADSTAAL